MSYDVDDNSMTKHGLDPRAFEAVDHEGKLKIVPAWPAVVLSNPKYPHNIGQTVRALSCFGAPQLWWTGKRALKSLEEMDRIPREERMRGYKDVGIYHHDRPLELFPKHVTPVAIEVRPNSENLVDFIHPENAVYVFGPEDGSIDQVVLRHCHRFVRIPTKHCTNLSAAVYLVLYDRTAKKARDGR
jgi:tRNA(Leu) C34 or U34 (ribose-2'-O)-methylase TrmL